MSILASIKTILSHRIGRSSSNNSTRRLYYRFRQITQNISIIYHICILALPKDNDHILLLRLNLVWTGCYMFLMTRRRYDLIRIKLYARHQLSLLLDALNCQFCWAHLTSSLFFFVFPLRANASNWSQRHLPFASRNRNRDTCKVCRDEPSSRFSEL